MMDGCIYLCCSKYWANWICLAVPEIVMIRSVDPWAGSSIVMKAFDSIRIRRMRVPALPIIAPANYNKNTHIKFNAIENVERKFFLSTAKVKKKHLRLLELWLVLFLFLRHFDHCFPYYLVDCCFRQGYCSCRTLDHCCRQDCCQTNCCFPNLDYFRSHWIRSANYWRCRHYLGYSSCCSPCHRQGHYFQIDWNSVHQSYYFPLTVDWMPMDWWSDLCLCREKQQFYISQSMKSI